MVGPKGTSPGPKLSALKLAAGAQSAKLSAEPSSTAKLSGKPSGNLSATKHSTKSSATAKNSASGGKKAPTLKVVLLGDLGVGKTCLRSQFVHHVFTNAYRATIGGDYLTTSVYLPSQAGQEQEPSVTQAQFDNNHYLSISDTHQPHQRNASESLEKVNLQIWDTAGQERFNSISQAFYRGTDVVVLVYDITNYESVLSIRDWFKRFLESCHVDKPRVVIVGNKIDKGSERCVNIDEIREILVRNNKISLDDYVENWDTDLVEVSSKKLDLVEKLFLRVAELGVDMLNELSEEEDPRVLKKRRRNILGFDSIDLTDGNFSSSSCAC